MSSPPSASVLACSQNSSAATSSPEPLATRLARKLGLARPDSDAPDVVTLTTSDDDDDNDDDDDMHREKTVREENGGFGIALIARGHEASHAHTNGKTAGVNRRRSDTDSSDGDGDLLRVDMPRMAASAVAHAADACAAAAATAAALAARRAGKRPANTTRGGESAQTKQQQKEEAARLRALEKARKDADKLRDKAVREVERRASKRKTTSERMEDLALTATTQVHLSMVRADALAKLHDANVEVHTADPPDDALGNAVEHVRWTLCIPCTEPDKVSNTKAVMVVVHLLTKNVLIQASFGSIATLGIHTCTDT